MFVLYVHVCVEHEGGASPSTAVVKGGGGSESDEEYKVDSRGSDRVLQRGGG